MRITIRLTFRDFLGISMLSLIYKSCARTIYCRIDYNCVKNADLITRPLDELSDFRKNAPDIGQIFPDSHYQGARSGRRSMGNLNSARQPARSG